LEDLEIHRFVVGNGFMFEIQFFSSLVVSRISIIQGREFFFHRDWIDIRRFLKRNNTTAKNNFFLMMLNWGMIFRF